MFMMGHACAKTRSEADLPGEVVCGSLRGCDDGGVDGRRARVGGGQAAGRRRAELLDRRTRLHVPGTNRFLVWARRFL